MIPSSLVAIALLTPLVAAGPCDIYASGGTPCVAAHSTTRALFTAFSGALYQVQRGSDNATTNIAPVRAGGVANSATQDTFCARTTCLITTIFDQTGRGNHLTKAPPGGAASGTDPGGFDNLAAADGAPVTLNGAKAYGVFIPPGTGYRNNAPSGTAVGDAAEGIYAVLDGQHSNNQCCFDYGNAETNTQDTGNGHMEVLSTLGIWEPPGPGLGHGLPLISRTARIFGATARGVNPNSPTITSRFVTAVVKGQPGNWAVRGGNSASGALSTFFNGARPTDGYNPMKKEGAILLGVGGDNSNWGQGTFYEGVMTTGFPSDATENAVQADIVAARYAATSLTTGPAITVGSAVSLRATTACCTTSYLSHSGSTVSIQTVTSASTAAAKLAASWHVVAGLSATAAANGCVSFEARDAAGSFLRHSGFRLLLNANDGTKLFAEDATWCPQTTKAGGTNSVRSWGFPAHYFRHFTGSVFAAANGGPNAWDTKTTFNDDASWAVEAAWA
ncbi:Alpha-l-arabinofuranosidase b [Mycena kentingensis (nom. inval.)]|nr:Alpha-l-arabinofuranosidase b [Mycena kentingensis (nom. inval.)]